MNQNADMRLESGTCNVCSAPCSSCMHLNRAFMGSKSEEFSDENCRLGETAQYSMDEGDVSSLRSRTCERLKHAAIETSNMLCVNSSHDSLSENSESRQALLNKYLDSKCLEGLDDNTSCISRASNANLVDGSHQRNSDRINISCSSASVSHLEVGGSGRAPSVDMSGLSEILSSKDADTGHSSPKAQSLCGQSQDCKAFSRSPSLMDLEMDSCSHIPQKLSESSVENVDSSLTKESAPIVVFGEKSLEDKDILINGTAKVSLKIYPKLEADGENDVSDAKDESRKYSVHDGQHEKTEELIKSPMPEPQSEDESDESDVVEHDVKVCDICGDAGREDLLAICSRCSDGAEHTYCMREMLQKVPEGEWLCEECKYAGETDNQRLDVEETKISIVSTTSQVSGKRHSENVEVATAVKRQAVESSTGSPKASSPKRIVPLSRESSFKILDKGKVKPGHQMPMRNHPGGDDIEIARSPSTGPQIQNAKSILLKSNSFNNFNSKPRVKLVDEAVPQKQKGGGEYASKIMETPSRMISKSMSFRSSNLGRSSVPESKVKILSSKSASAQDLKGLRHAKESGAFDRKFLSRIDRPVVCSTMASSVVSASKGDQKLTPRGETAKPSAVNTNRELKANQDGKSSTLSKSMNNISRKSLEPQVSSERTSTTVDETLEDELLRSQETANQVEKTKDSPSDCVKPGVTTSKSPFCLKCKDFGHPTECCTIGTAQESGAEVSATATSSSKDKMHKGNRLKAALQAALHRRPEIYKKKEVLDQTDEFPTSSTGLNCEVTSQDQVLVANTQKNSISAEETHECQEILENSTSETSKCLSANDLKQPSLCPTDICSQPGKSDFIGPAAGKPVVRDLPNQALGISSVLSKMSAIPEYEHIWQGVFEVYRGGKSPDLCTGIQAHLSTCASPKVLDVVNKFQSKVPLNEVSRLSTWPSQFHQDGAKEDNIALYFFAKDIESYERHYKDLLDHMIRNDLALKGIYDGVELLIFPSNQLPENSQRWNMLFFLWGVFRGRRINHSDSAEKICIPSLNVMPIVKGFPTAVMTLSETRCSPKRMDEESVAYDKACSALLPSTSIDQGHNMVSRNFDIKETIFDQTHMGSQVNLVEQDGPLDTKSTSRIPTSSKQLCQEMKSTDSSLKGSVLEYGQYRESKPAEAMGASVSSGILKSETDSDISIKRENALFSGIPSVCNQEIGAASNTSNISKDKISERMSNNEDQRRPKRKLTEDVLDIDMEATFQGDPTVKGVNCQLPNDKKVQHIDLSDTVKQASAVRCQKMPWNDANGRLEDGESSSKKLKTGSSGIYGHCSSGVRDSFSDSFVSLTNDLGSCSSVEDKACEEACDEKNIHEDFGTMERTFFPIDTHNKNDSQLVLDSMSLKGPLEYKDQFQVGIPNLELALGGETKAPHKGMLPFFVGALDKKNNREKPPVSLADEQEDESVAASLSLSLSFPSSNQEPIKPVSKAELLPDGHHVNTSFLLFGRFTDK